MLLQIENALRPQSCERLMALYDRYVGQASGVDTTGHSVLHCFADMPSSELALVRRVVNRAAERIAATRAPGAALCGDLVYPDTVILAAIGVGGRHAQHADNCQPGDDGGWVPNHTPHRAVSALYYLNDGFEGGELVFETQGLVVKPRPGLFVAFPSDERFVHEVLPVTSGRRYSMALWFTPQPALALPKFRAR